MKKIYTTTSPKQTRDLAKNLASEILAKGPGQRAIVLGLIGELGAGKTTFAQGFASGLNIRKKITSPTYVILKRFKITKIKNQKSKIKMTNQKSKRKEFKNFYHIDCHRIKEPQELSYLGFADINHEPKNIVLIEWADQIKKILPANTRWIKMEYLGKNRRKIAIEG